MSAPAIVPASYMKLSTLVDGTIRVVVDVEPRYLAAILTICAKPGAPVALAALTNEAAVAADHETVEVGGSPAAAEGEDARSLASARDFRPAASSPAPKRERTLAEKVAMRCQDDAFAAWLYRRWPIDWVRYGENTANFVRIHCGVNSRAEIVPGSRAEERWHTLEETYLAHARGVAA